MWQLMLLPHPPCPPTISQVLLLIQIPHLENPWAFLVCSLGADLCLLVHLWLLCLCKAELLRLARLVHMSAGCGLNKDGFFCEN